MIKSTNLEFRAARKADSNEQLKFWKRRRRWFLGGAGGVRVETLATVLLIALIVIDHHFHSVASKTTTASQAQQASTFSKHLLRTRSLRTSRAGQQPGNASSSISSKSSSASHHLGQQENKSPPVSLKAAAANSNACPPAASGKENYAGQGQWSNESFEFGAGSEEAAGSFGFTEPQVSQFVKPLFYTLRLKVDPTKRKFSGQLMISVEVAPPSEEEFQQLISNNSFQEPEEAHIARDKNGELGYRYLTLNVGASIRVKRAFYVYSSRGSVQIPATKVGKSAERELLTLDYYPNVITSGQGLLLIVYSGSVNETDSHGLFLHHSQRSRAFRAGGGGRPPGGSEGAHAFAGLATQMQPNFARRLLPAWDEPQLKARFSLIVLLPYKNYVILSNMALKRKSISLACSGEPLQELEFHTTPLMSTYLLALVIGRFDYIEATTASQLKIRAYVNSNLTAGSNGSDFQVQETNSRRSSAKLALETAVRTFDILESSLGVKYPLSKFDMVALRDFDNGGMENWGLSIFRESYFLYDAASNQTDIQLTGGRARSRRLEVPLVIAHEIAHQWFGNLVTSSSWQYLWLNEGFAQLLMYDVAQALFPNHNYWAMFVEDIRHSAMLEDELVTSSRALEFEVREQADQISLFDRITYNKGAMVVRMLQSLLGRESFTAGIGHYLLKHSYGSVSSHQLWQALEESGGRAEGTLEALMQPWLSLEGYPLLSLQVQEDAQAFRLRFQQERFTLLKLDEQQQQSSSQSNRPSQQQQPSANSSAREWTLPVLIASQAEPTPSDDLSAYSPLSKRLSNGFVLTARAGSLLLPKSQFGNWFKLNFNATGYFRVYYDSSSKAAAGWRPVDMLERLREPVKAKLLQPIDRFNLADDLFAMVKSGRRSSAYYMRYLIETFDEETEIIVLRSISETLKRIKAVVSNSDIKLNSLFDIYVQEYLRRVSEAVTRQRIQLMKDQESSQTSENTNNNSNLNSNSYEDTHQHSAAASSANQLQRLKEIEDLISATRVYYNDKKFLQKAADLFARNFRQPLSSATSANSHQQSKSSLFDSMDREMRASIYSGALIMSAMSDADLAPDFSINEQLKLAAGAARYPGSQWPPESLLGAQSSSISSLASPSSGSSAALAEKSQPLEQSLNNGQPEEDVFMRLLRAYETSDSNGERFAICAALGAVGQPQKQRKLLELVLYESYFRPADSVALLEAMARDKLGRELIFEQLRESSKLIERKQLLNLLLRSLSAGLVEGNFSAEFLQRGQLKKQPKRAPQETGGQPEESSSGDSSGKEQQIVEETLRALYQSYGHEYGKSISQLMESVRINSQWFRRDHDGLLQYLTMFASTLPSNHNS